MASSIKTGVNNLSKKIYYNELYSYSVSENNFFYYEDDGAGILIVYVGYLGPNGNSVSGTGNIANIIFNTLSAGQSEISISSTSRILDPDAKAITLNGYGKGTIDAQ